MRRAAIARPTRTPRNIPYAQTLMLRRRKANSRFLTDCYHFPAALRSGPCPKLGASSTSEYEAAPPTRLGDGAAFNRKSQENNKLDMGRRVCRDNAAPRSFPAWGRYIVSSPAGAGRPECQAGPLQVSYAQRWSGRGDRAPAGWPAWHIRKPARAEAHSDEASAGLADGQPPA